MLVLTWACSPMCIVIIIQNIPFKYLQLAFIAQYHEYVTIKPRRPNGIRKVKDKGKGNIYPRPDRDSPEVSRGIALLFH